MDDPNTPPPGGDPDQYWYGIDGVTHGPVDRDELLARLREGRVGPADWLWDADEDGWRPLRDFPELMGDAGAMPGARPDPHPVRYAGAAPRFVAWLIDQVVLIGPGLLWFFVASRLAGIDLGAFAEGPSPLEAALDGGPVDPELARFQQLLNLGGFALYWIYAALLESSSWQATVGKRMLGLKVTDVHGHRLGLWKASLRHVGKVASAFSLMLGFVMIAFMPKRQGLHDVIAQALVVVDRRR